ncbi:hypothetical protein BU17DRAFT_91366 [Hysterangium stoloniferum]|nr:hypothetical protein BU17DRAFT_91366 [Hysterangium stoloniferum]
MSDIEFKDVKKVPKKNNLSVDDAPDVVPQDDDSFTPLPEGRMNKKRLREVSLEASSARVMYSVLIAVDRLAYAAVKNIQEDENPVAIEPKPVEIPLKKNRLKSLEPTDVEVANPSTPPSIEASLLSASPPHNTKVRQIRRRVKDLGWQEAQGKMSDDVSVDDADQQDDGPEAAGVAPEDKGDEEDTSGSVSAKSDSDKDERPPVARLDKPPTERMDETVTALSSPKSGDTVEAASISEETPLSSAISRKDTITPSETPATGVSSDLEVCQGKRRREDGDQNPREAKRITPPPDKEKAELPPAATKPSGFMAYAGTASPFATASKGTNIFGTTESKPTFGVTTAPKPQLPSAFSSIPSSTSSTSSAVFGSSGFSAYASVSSPFVTAKPTAGPVFGATSSPGSKSPSRSKSPARHINAFGPYTTRSGKFAAPPKSRPAKKPKRGADDALEGIATGSGSASGSGEEAEGSPEPAVSASFGDILSAKDSRPDDQSDDESEKAHFTDMQEVPTGEEGEATQFQVRAKLFELIPAPVSAWKERGVGTLKLNVNIKTGRARLLLRNDGVLRLVLNTSLFKGMDFGLGQDPRYVKFGLIVDKKIVLHTLRFGSVKHAAELLSHLRAYTPGPEDDRDSEEDV